MCLVCSRHGWVRFDAVSIDVAGSPTSLGCRCPPMTVYNIVLMARWSNNTPSSPPSRSMSKSQLEFKGYALTGAPFVYIFHPSTHSHAYIDPKSFTDLQVKTFTPKQFESNDVEIAITHCGVCGSDVHTLKQGWGETKLPLVVGHEIVGKAVRVGSTVKGIKVGDRVGVGAQIWSCRQCRQCKDGYENYCPKQVDTYVRISSLHIMFHFTDLWAIECGVSRRSRLSRWLLNRYTSTPAVRIPYPRRHRIQARRVDALWWTDRFFTFTHQRLRTRQKGRNCGNRRTWTLRNSICESSWS